MFACAQIMIAFIIARIPALNSFSGLGFRDPNASPSQMMKHHP
jgi:hypothetical protein